MMSSICCSFSGFVCFMVEDDDDHDDDHDDVVVAFLFVVCWFLFFVVENDEFKFLIGIAVRWNAEDIL